MASKTYEMLWDCRFCGAKKLLGLSHRFCPECGAPQDATARYFPPDSERVAVEDHDYAGRDVVCPSCRDVSSRKAKHCTHCGGPLEGAREVEGRGERVVAEGQVFAGETRDAARRAAAAPAASEKRRSRWPLFVLLFLGIGAAVLLVAFLWKEDVALAVKSRHWSREIDIEQFGPKRESAWCDRLPPDAKAVSRTRKERSKRRIPDGETCRTRKVDNGDGTYRETRECEPKYREEPVYDDHCSYSVDRWGVVRKVTAEGRGVAAPAWPQVGSLRAGSSVGSEREAARRETYAVDLTDAKGKVGSCEVDAARYARLAEGTRWLAERRGLTGGILCDTLRAAP
jgi:predicted amidophosphoribosyltransferase